MIVEGCTVALAIISLVTWLAISRRNWKRRALDAETKLGRRLKDLRVKGED